jgi:hypothetical protein
VKVSENRVLRKMFGPKRDEVTKWRRLHTEVLHDLYCSPNIVRVTKLRIARWAGHVACTGEERGRGFWRENLKEKDQLEDPYVGVGNKEQLVGNIVL